MQVSRMIELLRRFPHDAELIPSGVGDDGDWQFLIDMSQSSIAAGLSEDEHLCWLNCTDDELPAALGRSFDF